MTLLHHVNVDSLRAAFYALKRNAAAGADGVTWQEYADGLENHLVDLCDRVHRGAYRATPSRRVYIPKPDGGERPLGIATLEDCIFRSISTIYSGGSRPLIPADADHLFQWKSTTFCRLPEWGSGSV